MQTRILRDGLRFPEAPRWRDGRLWFSDIHDYRVAAVDLDGTLETIAVVPGQPSGLGWTRDGNLLVVSMVDRKLCRVESGELVEVADLSAYATFHCNDMVVDAHGRAYVGNFGWDIFDASGTATPQDACLVLVGHDGSSQVAADGLNFPNGTVITPDGSTLIVGETFGARLTAFTVAPDGSLSDRRVWAQLDAAVPDGICLDAEGAIWVASPISGGVLRVREGGEVVQKIAVEREAFACMLGGPQGRHLFICTAADSNPAKCRAERTGRIEVVEVEVPGAGLP